MAAGGDRAPKIDRLAVWALNRVRAAARALAAGYLWLNNRDRADAPALPAPRRPEWEKIAPTWRWLVVALATLVCVAAAALAIWLFFDAAIDAALGEPEPRGVQIALLIVAAVVGAPFVVWRTILAAQQTRINQQTHFTDLFTKAVELLGADKTVKRRAPKPDAPGEHETVEETAPNIEVRLGAIYALERIMRQSPDDYWPIVSTLCAYVRQNATMRQEPTDEDGAPIPAAPAPPPIDEPESAADLAARLAAIEARSKALQAWAVRLRKAAAERGAPGAQRPDIRAALEAVAHRDVRLRIAHEGVTADGDPPVLPERPDDLPPEEAEARRAVLRAHGEALLAWSAARRRPDLAGIEVQGGVLPDVELRRADLRGARLEGANLGLARLEGADLYQARLEGADLFGARLRGADLRAARLEGAVLYRARLDGVLLIGARLEGADLSWAGLEGADISEARLEGAALYRARLEGANLNETRLEGANLSRARLETAHLLFARLNKAILTGARLTGADLSETGLEGAELARARLDDATLWKARLQGAGVARARFARALLAGADFTGVADLTYRQLASAFGDAATVLPDDLEAERPRLVAEALWAEDELTEENCSKRWAAWRVARGFA